MQGIRQEALQKRQWRVFEARRRLFIAYSEW